MEQLKFLTSIVIAFAIGCIVYTVFSFIGWVMDGLGICIGAC